MVRRLWWRNCKQLWRWLRALRSFLWGEIPAQQAKSEPVAQPASRSGSLVGAAILTALAVVVACSA